MSAVTDAAVPRKPPTFRVVRMRGQIQSVAGWSDPSNALGRSRPRRNFICCMACGRRRVQLLYRHLQGECPHCGDLSWMPEEDAIANPEALRCAIAARSLSEERLLLDIAQADHGLRLNNLQEENYMVDMTEKDGLAGSVEELAEDMTVERVTDGYDRLREVCLFKARAAQAADNEDEHALWESISYSADIGLALVPGSRYEPSQLAVHRLGDVLTPEQAGFVLASAEDRAEARA